MITVTQINQIIHPLFVHLKEKIPQIKEMTVSQISCSKHLGSQGRYAARMHIVGDLNGLITLSLNHDIAVIIAERLSGENSVETISEKALSTLEATIQDALQLIPEALKVNGLKIEGALLPFLSDQEAIVTLDKAILTFKIALKYSISSNLMTTHVKRVPVIKTSANVDWPNLDLYISLSDVPQALPPKEVSAANLT